MWNYQTFQVDFGKYDAVISFLNVDDNHWKFLVKAFKIPLSPSLWLCSQSWTENLNGFLSFFQYLHASSSQIFIINPQGTDEEKDSEQAAIRFR